MGRSWKRFQWRNKVSERRWEEQLFARSFLPFMGIGVCVKGIIAAGVCKGDGDICRHRRVQGKGVKKEGLALEKSLEKFRIDAGHALPVAPSLAARGQHGHSEGPRSPLPTLEQPHPCVLPPEAKRRLECSHPNTLTLPQLQKTNLQSPGT